MTQGCCLLEPFRRSRRREPGHIKDGHQELKSTTPSQTSIMRFSVSLTLVLAPFLYAVPAAGVCCVAGASVG